MKLKRSKTRRNSTIDEAQYFKTFSLVAQITKKIGNAGITFHKDKRILHWLAKASIICFAVAYFLQIIALANATDDVDRLFECFSDICFCGMGILKLLSLFLNHKQWSILLQNITELENEQSNNDEESSVEYESDEESTKSTFSRHIFSYTQKFHTVSTLLSRIYCWTLVIYIISPFAEYALFKGAQDTGRWPHILPGWTPLDNLHFSGYLFTIFIELVAAVYCVFIHIAFDLTSVGVMIFICGQFSLLRDYSENIGGAGVHWRLSKSRDDRAHHRIARCHKIHVLLINSTDKLGKLLKNILGVYFFVATLTLCSVAVRLNSELSSMQLVSLLQYMCATLTQLFLFCCYGDNVLYESSVDTGRGPFGAAHWCLSPRVRRELTLLGLGMMVPQRFYAGPFFSLDLQSFIQVVRTAYSYYAVIRK